MPIHWLPSNFNMSIFYEIEDFPELIPIRDTWKSIRDEAMEHINSFYMVGEDVPDDRNTKNKWRMMPVKPATDDLTYNIESGGNMVERIEKWKDKFTILRNLCDAIPGCNEYCLSLLESGGHIGAHSHGRNNVSCILGLDVPKLCYLRVGKCVRITENGKFNIFPFREKHEAWNGSDKGRLVLLVTLPNRYEKSGFLNYIKEKENA